MHSVRPESLQQRDELAPSAALEMVVKADQLCALIEASGVTWEQDIKARIWGVVGLAFRAGRLFPQEVIGEQSFFDDGENPGSSNALHVAATIARRRA